MNTQLNTGESYDLSRNNTPIPSLELTVSWKTTSEANPDLDTSLFLLTKDHKLPGDDHFVFYNNLRSPDDAVIHHGDDHEQKTWNRESIEIRLGKLSPLVSEIPVILSIHDADLRGFQLSLLESLTITGSVSSTKEIVFQFQPKPDPIATEMEIGRFLRKHDKWLFQGTDAPSRKGLLGYVELYG